MLGTMFCNGAGVGMGMGWFWNGMGWKGMERTGWLSLDLNFGHGKERKGEARRGKEGNGKEWSSGKAYTVVHSCTSCTSLSITLHLQVSPQEEEKTRGGMGVFWCLWC